MKKGVLIIIIVCSSLWFLTQGKKTDIFLDEQSQSYTERYEGQVGRVQVVFEQTDYARFRLTTNDLVREGDLEIGQGFGDDQNAVVYTLNIHGNNTDQIRYVKRSAEPETLYLLDSTGGLILGTPLRLK